MAETTPGPATGTVHLETVSPRPIAVVGGTTTLAEFGSQWKPMLDEVWAFLAAGPDALRPHGHNVMIYRDPPGSGDGSAEGTVEVEVGVEVATTFDPVGRVVPSVLPAGRAAAAVHSGSPEQLRATYGAVVDWCAAHGYSRTGTRWEVYGHADADGRFTTSVYWLLDRSAGTG